MFSKHIPWPMALLMLLAACNTAAPTPLPNPTTSTAITSFGATPNPTPANVVTQFSWSVTGNGLTCNLDIDNNATTDYSVPDCTSQSRVTHVYGAQGSYTAKLTVTGTDGLTREQITPVSVVAANVSPTIPVLTAAPGAASDPLSVAFDWTTTDGNADITRCEFDADSDGKLDYNGLCNGLDSSNGVAPANTVSHRYTHKYSRVGRYTATLMAYDPYISVKSSVAVRVPYNREPIIGNLQASGSETGVGRISFEVSDPDGDTLTCKLSVETIGKFTYPNCKSIDRVYQFAGPGVYQVTLEVLDGMSTLRRNALITCGQCSFDYAKPNHTVVIGGGSSGEGAVALVYDPINYRLAVAIEYDTYYSFIRIYDAITGIQVGSDLVDPGVGVGKLGFAHKGEVTNLAFSPDGKLLVSASLHDEKVKVWRVSSRGGVLLRSFYQGSEIDSMALSPDGSLVAAASRNKIRLWNMATGLEAGTGLTGLQHSQSLSGGLEPRIKSLTFFEEAGSLKLVSGSEDHSVKIWDITGTGGGLERTLGHSAPVAALAYTPDGSMLALSDEQGVIRFYDPTTGVQLGGDLVDATLGGLDQGKAHNDTIHELVFSDDGSLLASGAKDNSIKLWSISGSSATLSDTLTGHTDDVSALAFNDDATLLVSGSLDDSIKLWAIASGAGTLADTLTGHTDDVSALDFNHDGTLLASGSYDASIKLWTIASGAATLLQTINSSDAINGTGGLNKYHKDYVTSLVFSEDGSLLLSGDVGNTGYGSVFTDDGYVYFWSVEQTAGPNLGKATYTSRFSMGEYFSAKTLAIRPDASLLAVGTSQSYSYPEGNLVLLDISSPASVSEVDRLNRPETSIAQLAFNDDGSQLASADSNHGATLWSITGTTSADFAFERDLGHHGEVRAVAVSSQNILAVGDVQYRSASAPDSWGSVYLYNPISGAPLGKPLEDSSLGTSHDQVYRAHRAGVVSLGFSPSGSQLATGGLDYKVRLWNISGAGGTFDSVEATHQGQEVWEVLLYPHPSDPGRMILASANEDSTFRLTDLTTGEYVYYGIVDTVRSMAFSPDSSQLVTGLDDGYLRVYNTANWAPVATDLTNFDPVDPILVGDDAGKAHAKDITAVAFHPGGKFLVTGDAEGILKLWSVDGDSYTLIYRLWQSCCRINSLVFSQDGSLLASAADDWMVTLLAIENDSIQYLEGLMGHTDGIEKVAFSPDGTTLASASRDGNVILFTLDFPYPSTQVAIIPHAGIASFVEFINDGKMLVTAGKYPGEIYTWAISETQISLVNTVEANWNTLVVTPDEQAIVREQNYFLHRTNPVTGAPIGGPIPTFINSDSNGGAMAISPNGLYMATSDSRNILVIHSFACVVR